ncbi:sensor histidine kinase [Viridibacterium curvum]|uniref:histidine kinase n=1 Tax=Viridibacterium curvum TaxID=1101404 RepID=A0ABP9QU70_9RHOO
MQTDSSAAAPSIPGADPGVIFVTRLWRFILFVVVPVTIMVWLYAPPAWPQLFVLPALVATSLGMREALRRNRLRLSVGLLQWGMLATLTMQCCLVNGIRTPTVMGYPVLLSLSGWLLDRRSTIRALLATLVILTVLAALDGTFWTEQVPRLAVHYWVTVALICCVTAMLTLHISESQQQTQTIIRDNRDAMARQIRDLQRTRDRLATLSNVNPVPVSVTLVSDGTYLEANPAWLRLSGWSREEMVGRRSTDLNIWRSQEERDTFANLMRAQGYVSSLPATFRMRDGQERHFLLSAELVDYDEQKAIFSAFVDVTVLRHTEEALATLNHELEQRVRERTASLTQAMDILRRAQDELVQSDKLASLGSVVAGVAHELNTPIGNSVLITSTLAQGLRSVREAFEQDALRKSALASHLEESARAVSLLESSLSRASHMVASFKQVAIDQSSERRRSFNLHELVRDICETLRPGMRHQAWRLEADLVEGLQLDSYPGPLGQVISNLVQNAFFHGLQENAPGMVRIRMWRDDAEHVSLSVEDNGRGIDPAVIGRIFDPFFTTRLGQGGSGLGLSIVYRLVTTVLGGRIQVESRLGEGTCFTVSLPITAP